MASPADQAMTGLKDPGRPKPFAHHPDCFRYDHHLVYIAGEPVCLGCFFMATGLLVSIPLFLAASRMHVPFPGAVAASLILGTPSFFQPFLQVKWFKAASRCGAGIGSGFLFLSLVFLVPFSTEGHLLRLAIVAAYYALAVTALRIRRLKRVDPCEACPYGVKPLCVHYLDALEVSEEDARGGGPPGVQEFLQAVIRDLRRKALTWPSDARRGGCPSGAFQRVVKM